MDLTNATRTLSALTNETVTIADVNPVSLETGKLVPIMTNVDPENLTSAMRMLFVSIVLEVILAPAKLDIKVCTVCNNSVRTQRYFNVHSMSSQRCINKVFLFL